MKDVNAIAPKKALSFHMLFPHMTKWGSGYISDISHLNTSTDAARTYTEQITLALLMSIQWGKFTPTEFVTQSDSNLSIFFYEIDPRNASFIFQAWQKQLKGSPITLKVRADKAQNPEIAYFTTLIPFQADLLPWKPKTPHQRLYLGN